MANANEAQAGKMYSEDTIAVLLAANGVSSISMKQYDMMSALDGSKTAASFQHQFRPILRKAKELKAKMDSGESFVPVTPSSKKRAVDKLDGAEGPSTPTKKGKGTPKAAAKPKIEKKTPKKKEPSLTPEYDLQATFEQDIPRSGDDQNYNNFVNEFEQNFVKYEPGW